MDDCTRIKLPKVCMKLGENFVSWRLSCYVVKKKKNSCRTRALMYYELSLIGTRLSYKALSHSVVFSAESVAPSTPRPMIVARGKSPPTRLPRPDTVWRPKGDPPVIQRTRARGTTHPNLHSPAGKTVWRPIVFP